MRPKARLLVLLSLWLAFALAAAFVPALLPAWGGLGGALVVLALLDLTLLLRRRPPTLSRTVAPALSLGVFHRVSLRLENDGPARTVEVYDGAPTACEVEGQPQRVALPASGWAEVEYRARPRERGELRFGKAELLLTGPVGLLRRRVLAGEEEVVRVFPNFRQVAQLAMLALDQRTARMGIHLRRRRGEGTEFWELREYRQGDALRQIDWKAFSRRSQLISREYREEQNQQVVFLLDCGRRMHAAEGDITHFDHVLNAVLLLAYVALRQGDAVGVMTFSGQDRWLPPVKGRAGMNSILNAVFDLRTSTAPSDYAEAAQRLTSRQKRRALVVLLTNLRDDDTSDLATALAPVRKRHLLLLSSLREPELERAAADPIEGFDDALRVAATHHYLEARRRAHDLVRGQGVRLLDAEPDKLPVALVNRYLDIKKSGVL